MLKDIFGPILTKNLTPSNIKRLNQKIVSYVDENSELILSLDLSHRYSFNDADRAIVYDVTGITEVNAIAEIEKSKDINKTNKIQSNPFYIMCILTIHDLLSKHDEKSAKLLMNYMSLMMYTSIHKGSFKYNVNKQIMDYTIAHLDNSYIIKKSPSLYAWLEDNASTTFLTYKSRIERCNDSDITYVVDALWVRIKGKIKKIAQAFYKNYSSGNYLNTDTDSYDENDYHEMDNNSYAINRLTNKVYTKLINHQFDKRFIKYSITQSDTSYQKLANLIEDILDDDQIEHAQKTISSLIEYYLIQSGRSYDYIAKGDFIAYMKTAYASNTDLEQMVFVKTMIDTWLDENMYKYGKANYGKTAKQQYRKSIYMFFVFIINYEAKSQ